MALCKRVPTAASCRASRTRVMTRCSAQTTHVITKTRVVVKDFGASTLQGTVRRINEDRWDAKVAEPGAVGEPFVFAGVYDGHGGNAVADFLSKKLFSYIQDSWKSDSPVQAITDAYLAADKVLVAAKSGFMGLGERGVGGSKCGATAATVLLFPGEDGTTKLLTANIGDARVVLCRGGKALQLTVDHVPDDEVERKRIESKNPNPKMPLVRFVSGTWRVGGLLALSRAFGDAYLKGSGYFEGRAEGSDNYSSGFGLIAEPHTTFDTLTDEDTYIIVSSDGLYTEESRGGGGGLDNERVAAVLAASRSKSCEQLAKEMAREAQQQGSTDDVTVVVLRLGA